MTGDAEKNDPYLDEVWVVFFKEAVRLGISVDEIRDFLKKNKKNEEIKKKTIKWSQIVEKERYGFRASLFVLGSCYYFPINI